MGVWEDLTAFNEKEIEGRSNEPAGPRMFGRMEASFVGMSGLPAQRVGADFHENDDEVCVCTDCVAPGFGQMRLLKSLVTFSGFNLRWPLGLLGDRF